MSIEFSYEMFGSKQCCAPGLPEHEHRGGEVGGDRSELHRALRAALRDAPDLRELERDLGRDLVHDSGVLPAAHDLVQPGPDRVRPHRVGGLDRLLRHPLEALGRIEEPRPAGEVGVEVVVAVRDDVEAGALLVSDHGADGVDELLAVCDVAHAVRERAAVEVVGVPRGPRPGAGDGGRKDQVVRCGQHRRPFSSLGRHSVALHGVKLDCSQARDLGQEGVS
jgi:hypothetical protein